MKIQNLPTKLILLSLLTFSAHSNEFDFQAFGTIGSVYNDNSNYIYRKDIFQKDGSSGDLSFETDTIIGLQSTFTINENYSILLQGIAKNDYDDKVRAKFDQGYLKFDSNENFILKLGRIRTPYYRNSENLNIGYSTLMIRESVEVYGQVPFSSYNGAQIIYSNLIDKYFYTIQAGYGKEELTVPIHSLNQKVDVEIDNLYTLNLTFGTTALQARVTYLNADITASNQDLNQLFKNLRISGLSTLADQYEYKDKRSEYLSFGLFLDYKNFLFSTEYGQRKISSFFADTHGYSITLAYSFDKLIPFITYAQSEMDEATYDANTASDDLNTLLLAQNLAQTSKTVGIKYYINNNLDIKFQYEYVTPKGDFGSYHLSSLEKPQNLNVFSFAMDFIF